MAETDVEIREILTGVKTIAVVGWSPKPDRPSHRVAAFLHQRGYRVIPVNPGLAGQTLNGETVYASLKDIPQDQVGRIDMVDIFRNSDAAGAVAQEAAELGVPVIWMQLGVRNDEAAARAEAMGATVIMNRCPKIEYGRLSGEIGWQGINSRILSAKKPALAGKGFQKLTINRPGT